MRTLALAAVLVTSSTAHTAPRRVAVLGVSPVDATDRGTVFVAAQLTLALREVARDTTTTQSLTDLKATYNCASEAPACMAAIGAGLGADLIVYGTVERIRDFTVSVKVLDVRAKTVGRAVRSMLAHADATEAGIKAAVPPIYAKLVP